MSGGINEHNNHASVYCSRGGFMYSGFVDGIGSLIVGLMLTCAVFVPLGIWKLVDIGIWFYHHVHIGVSP